MARNKKRKELYQTALHELDNLPFDTTALRALAEFIVNRKKLMVTALILISSKCGHFFHILGLTNI